MTRYFKAIVALLGALATWGITAAEDNTYTQVELWGALLAVVTAVGVYVAPNDAPAGELPDPDISERGATDFTFAAAVAVFAALAVYVLLDVTDKL